MGERIELDDIASITEPSASIEEANDNAFVLELNEVSVSVVKSVDKIVRLAWHLQHCFPTAKVTPPTG